MKKIILNSCIVLLLFSCALEQKDVYYKVDPKTKIQFKQGDTLLFKSASRTDTFKISSISDDFKVSDKIYHQEFYSVNYQKLNIVKSVDSNNYGIYYIGKTSNATTSNITDIQWKNLYDDRGYYKQNDTTIKIGDLLVKNIKMLNDSSTIKHYLNYTKKVCFCDLYGVVEYSLYNGERFILDSICLEKYIK